RCCVSYNGEFYNHRQFRHGLENRGTRFRGRSDTETLLYLLEQYGPGSLEGVAGIFAVAFWDGRHRRPILARGPLRVKQLYYHDNGRRIVFGSEIKALLQSPDVPRRIDPEAVNEYLHFHTPLYERTFFADIKQVAAGDYLEVNSSGIHRRTYWQADGFEPRTQTPDAPPRAPRPLLAERGREHIMADAPAGAVLT